jgi:glycosyltransferase involved in cell wall biosynthesis
VSALGDATLDVTVVVPYFNPGSQLRPSVEALVAALDRLGVSYEVIAVSDGSTDGSEGTLDGTPPDKVRRVNLGMNVGKGHALRVGLAMGRGRYLGFIDADGDVSPDQLGRFVALMPLYEPDIVLGSKRHPMSDVDYPVLRRVYSWGFQQLIRLLFRLRVRDTQTGIKLIRRDVLESVLPYLVEKRFAFDLELFVVARHLGFRKFFEAPVSIRRQFASTVSIWAVLAMVADTFAIWWRLKVQHYYDLPPESLPALLSAPEAAVGKPLGTSASVVRRAGDNG